jgi:hypothetical protein
MEALRRREIANPLQISHFQQRQTLWLNFLELITSII